MNLIRVDFAKRFYESGIAGQLINTVHDSIVLDIPDDKANQDLVINPLDNVCNLFYNSLQDFPKRFCQIFDVEFDLDIECEIEFGINQYELEKYAN